MHRPTVGTIVKKLYLIGSKLSGLHSEHILLRFPRIQCFLCQRESSTRLPQCIKAKSSRVLVLHRLSRVGVAGLEEKPTCQCVHQYGAPQPLKIEFAWEVFSAYLRDFLGVSSSTAESREHLLTFRRDRVATTRPTSMATAPCGVVVPDWPSEPSMEGTHEGSATAQKSVRDFEFTERFQDFSKDFRFQPIQQKISRFQQRFQISTKISAKISDFAKISAEISRFHVIFGEISRFQDPFQFSAEISW